MCRVADATHASDETQYNKLARKLILHLRYHVWCLMLGVENLLNCNQVVGMFKLILRGIVVGRSRITFVGSVWRNAVTVNFAQIVLDCN